MSMTREELRQWFAEWLDDYYDALYSEDDLTPEVAESVLTALQGPTREMVEMMRGEWMFKPFYKGTSRGAIECQECKGAFEGSVEFNFCPNCGAPMTDKAVDMVMERLGALHE